jgi:hypothetical protein
LLGVALSHDFKVPANGNPFRLELGFWWVSGHVGCGLSFCLSRQLSYRPLGALYTLQYFNVRMVIVAVSHVVINIF